MAPEQRNILLLLQEVYNAIPWGWGSKGRYYLIRWNLLSFTELTGARDRASKRGRWHIGIA